MTATSSSSHLSDEIELIAVVERGVRFFKRYNWLFTVATLAGLALGLFAYSYLPTVYKSRMIVHSFLLTNQEQLKMVETWNELLTKKEYEVLAAQLQCPASVLSRVKKLSAEEIQKVFSPANPNGYTIEATVTSNEILPPLQQALMNGLENGDYVKSRLAARRATLTELIGTTREEVLRLDSTKKAVEAIIAGKGKSSSPLLIDGAAINRQLVDMNEKLLGYQDELRFVAAAQVLQGFSPFKTPSGPHLVPWLVIGLGLMLGLVCLLAFCHSIYSRLKSRSKQLA